MINGVRLFLHPGVVAELSGFRDDPSSNAYFDAFFVDAMATPPISESVIGSSAYANVYTWGTVPTTTGQPDPSTNFWQPYYNGDSGIWELLEYNSSFPPNPPYYPGGQYFTDAASDGFALLNAISRYPANPPIVKFGPRIGLTGDSDQPMPDIHGVQILITQEGAATDHWYGATGVGKYGWITEIYEDGSNGTMQWINFVKTRLFLKLNF